MAEFHLDKSTTDLKEEFYSEAFNGANSVKEVFDSIGEDNRRGTEKDNRKPKDLRDFTVSDGTEQIHEDRHSVRNKEVNSDETDGGAPGYDGSDDDIYGVNEGIMVNLQSYEEENNQEDILTFGSFDQTREKPDPLVRDNDDEDGAEYEDSYDESDIGNEKDANEDKEQDFEKDFVHRLLHHTIERVGEPQSDYDDDYTAEEPIHTRKPYEDPVYEEIYRNDPDDEQNDRGRTPYETEQDYEAYEDNEADDRSGDPGVERTENQSFEHMFNRTVEASDKFLDINKLRRRRYLGKARVIKILMFVDRSIIDRYKQSVVMLCIYLCKKGF